MMRLLVLSDIDFFAFVEDYYGFFERVTSRLISLNRNQKTGWSAKS